MMAEAAMARPAGDILVVDDDAGVREVLVDILRDEGYAVAYAENGREAMAWLQTHPRPRLILLDLWMPVMSGSEFREAQLGVPALADIPVVIMTAVPDHRRPTLPSVAADFLPKPVALDRLLDVVAAYVPRRDR